MGKFKIVSGGAIYCNLTHRFKDNENFVFDGNSALLKGGGAIDLDDFPMQQNEDINTKEDY